MIDHVSLPVQDLVRSRRLYETMLASIGYSLVMEHEISGVGFGVRGKPTFWLRSGGGSSSVHVAFAVSTHSAVDAFYASAIHAGAACNGKPGVRSEYHPTYYGAFVLDPDGNNIEAVCHFEAT